MSTILIFIAALLACSLLAIWRFRVKSRQGEFTVDRFFQDAQTRKLLPEAQRGENYLDNLSQDPASSRADRRQCCAHLADAERRLNSVVILTHSHPLRRTTDDLAMALLPRLRRDPYRLSGTVHQ